MKKKLAVALTLSLLALSTLSFSFAKSSVVSGGTFSTPAGASAWAN